MTAVLLDGDALAATLRRTMAEQVARLPRPPRMATVLVGDNPASRSYIARKHADCVELGIQADLIALPADTPAAALLAEVARLNADPAVDGFFVQFPLPDGHDERAIAAAIAPAKDIDGLSPENLGRMVAGLPGHLPCTPSAVLALRGAAGADILNGGVGNDVLFGGAGADQFWFNMSDAGVDLIADAESGDFLRLNGVTLYSLTAGDGASVGTGHAQVQSSGGVTSILLGLDGTAGYDFRVDLNGTFSVADFQIFNSGYTGADLILI